MADDAWRAQYTKSRKHKGLKKVTDIGHLEVLLVSRMGLSALCGGHFSISFRALATSFDLPSANKLLQARYRCHEIGEKLSKRVASVRLESPMIKSLTMPKRIGAMTSLAFFPRVR